MEDEEPKVRFVENLDYVAQGICLYWIKEIHIDEKYRDHPALNDLIAHERKHYVLITKAIQTKSRLRRWTLFLWNNIWDIFDRYRIKLKFFRHLGIVGITDFVTDFVVLLFVATYVVWVILQTI